VGNCRTDHATPHYQQKLALKFADQRRSLSRYNSLRDQKATEFCVKSVKLDTSINKDNYCEDPVLAEVAIVLSAFTFGYVILLYSTQSVTFQLTVAFSPVCMLVKCQDDTKMKILWRVSK
jgi:hypothetical protein